MKSLIEMYTRSISTQSMLMISFLRLVESKINQVERGIPGFTEGLHVNEIKTGRYYIQKDEDVKKRCQKAKRTYS